MCERYVPGARAQDSRGGRRETGSAAQLCTDNPSPDHLRPVHPTEEVADGCRFRYIRGNTTGFGDDAGAGGRGQPEGRDHASIAETTEAERTGSSVPFLPRWPAAGGHLP